MTFDCTSNPEEERAHLQQDRREAFCRDLDMIDDAIAEEFSEWDGYELAEAVRDRDVERIGRIFLARVTRKLHSNAMVLA